VSDIKATIVDAAAKAVKAFGEVTDSGSVDELRIKFLGKKGEITLLARGMKDAPKEQRPELGKSINEAKKVATKAMEQAKARIEAGPTTNNSQANDMGLDVTLPGRRRPMGTIHPINRVWREIEQIFAGLGFSIEDGPEVETEWYNFDALNFPKEHPARDLQDTLFVEGGLVMRTHTSPVQIRVMEKQKPPIQMICPGWVYRNETIDATHSPMFSQIEGLMVGENITFGDLKGVLNEFVQQFYGTRFKTRFRPHFFPFTEPSAEMDISCFACNGSGTIQGITCRVCKGTGWKEILGAGMVDVNVYKAVGYDPEKVTGFAFGMGIERITMFRYGIDEIRHFFDGDIRFLKQF
jgi:phenylalanyl-tRNA synthetase alpha chain